MDSQTSLGIVSPCSKCKNQKAESSAGGTFCPRRYWEARYQAAQDDGLPVIGYEHLIASGKDSADGSLRNPVYTHESIIVWVALLKDNPPQFDKTGQLTARDILDPDFDTANTACQLHPFLPTHNEAQYFQSGRLQEKDQLLVHITPLQQVSIDTGRPYELGGTISRLNLLKEFPRAPLLDHQAPEGT